MLSVINYELYMMSYAVPQNKSVNGCPGIVLAMVITLDTNHVLNQYHVGMQLLVKSSLLKNCPVMTYMKPIIQWFLEQ